MKYRKRIDKKEHHQKVVMGDCSELPQRNGFYPNGLVVEEVGSITRPIDTGRWAKAEKRTAELISCIQPNRPSENHRNAVASYVQRLVSNCVPCEVFTFGSVPLKTYLPDGDIDLTAFSEDPNLKDNWAVAVQGMLLMEESNEHAEFPVKEVQLIQAEVRIIKCLVDNVVVDISFNQLGGLCTLCFLEEVDNLISQNHLFKRSIVLIKAWCFYESRILGAHHGLISTYALETLVLYIFHVFNNSFSGPLEVLYRFLEFFSKFDWANFCVSLWGPVPISSLPRMAADPPRKDGGHLLLSKMFLDACGTAYSVFPAAPENREIHFSSKHLNVVDPLRLNNNLGRSVSKGNFYRIRSAFSLGARQLGKILECPAEDIVPELNQFFVNTWDRHGKGCRPDALIHKGLSSPKQQDNDELRSQISSGADHFLTERSKLRKKQHDDIKRTCMMNILQTRGHTTHHFARTSSSPELTNMSSEASPNCRYNVATEKVNDDISSSSGYSRRKVDPVSRENHVPNRSTDEPSIRESPSHHSIASDSENSLSSCVSKVVSSSTTPVISSVPEPRHIFVEEQHIVNKLSSSGIQHYGGHVQMPVNLASYSFVPFPPSIMGYNQQNFASTMPTNSSTVESDWGTMMNYSNGPFPVPFHQQILPFGVVPEQEDMTGRMNERVVSPGVDAAEDSGFWIDDHTNGGIDHESVDFSTATSRLLPASPCASSRTKASSENSWDGKPTKIASLSRYPLGKNGSSTRNADSTVNTRWEEDSEPVDHSCEGFRDDPSVTTSDLEVNHIPVFEQPQISCRNSVSSVGSLLVPPGSLQGAVHNHAILPVAFYHAGPPPPFVTMIPVHNLPAETGTSGGVTTGHSNVDEGNPPNPYPMNRSGCSTNLSKKQEGVSRTDSYVSKNVSAAGENSDECDFDIFNSDFASHLKNLLYGRLCQDLQFRHPYLYPPSVLSIPFQETSNVASPGRPGTFDHAVPVSAHQPGAVSPVGVSRQYGGEISKQRNGTGTYFPNPDIIKERQCPNPRQYQGDYGHDRNENHRDKEPNRNANSKPRFGGRQTRNYYEKQNTKIDRSDTSISQTARTWDTFQEDSNPLYCLSKYPPPSNSSQYVPDAVDYSVYQVHSVNSDEVSSAGDALQHLVMMCPYPPPGDHDSWTENLQFGSLLPEHFIRTQVQEFSGYSKGGAYELSF